MRLLFFLQRHSPQCQGPPRQSKRQKNPTLQESEAWGEKPCAVI